MSKPRGKGYKLARNQAGLPKGWRRYQLDVFIEGTRYRDTITSPWNEIDAIFKRWLHDQLNDEPVYRFFETLDKFMTHLRSCKGPATVQATEYAIVRFKTCFKDMLLDAFRRSHVEDYVSWRKSRPNPGHLKTVKPATINRDLAVLSHYFAWAISRDMYSRVNPAYRAQIPEHNRREIQLNEEQIRELLGTSLGMGSKFTTALLLALLAGLRRQEALFLEWQDVDFEYSSIRVRASSAKGHKSRVVPMPRVLQEWLFELRKHEPASVRVFSDYRTPARLRFEFQRFRKQLSFGRLQNGLTLCFHDLRRLYGQALRFSGVELSDIRSLMGHSSVRITEANYVLFARPDLHEAVERLNTTLPLDVLASNCQPYVKMDISTDTDRVNKK